MKSKELRQLGIPGGECVRLAGEAIRDAIEGGVARSEIPVILAALVDDPRACLENEYFGVLAEVLHQLHIAQRSYRPRRRAAPFRQWGRDLDESSIQQMRNACQLPVSVRGALMPDAHVGYGLPIGGVLATRNAVIPYAVGVDIACRMRMSVLDLPTESLDARPEQLTRAIEAQTRFGIGASFQRPRSHDVMDEDWSITPVTARVRDKAWTQLGSSGSGNHFVEFGFLELQNRELGLEPGSYLTLLSHSGSRGAGATVAGHYSKLAMEAHPELPRELRHLAWLDLDSAEGQEYWGAMELMGRYAAANHACIHRHVSEHLGSEVLAHVENHHNFAWQEEHDGETLIVHRKGATPADVGVVGIIPGSMASPTYVVRGRGNADSLNSAAHGAGRVMSRTQAKKKFRWREVKRYLDERKVQLLSAGLDEAPMVYKNIDEVMAAQADLVGVIGKFTPRLVKMAPPGERPED